MCIISCMICVVVRRDGSLHNSLLEVIRKRFSIKSSQGLDHCFAILQLVFGECDGSL
jgi:hypothetical protein